MEPGLYESLLSRRLEQQLNQTGQLVPELAPVEDIDQPDTLVRHLTPLIQRALAAAKGARARTEMVRRVLQVLDLGPDSALDEVVVHAEPGVEGAIQQLLSLIPDTPDPVAARVRPVSPLSASALMTNAKGEPSLAAELGAEIMSADRVDLLCAFVKWQGVRILGRQLAELRRRQIPFRVITTTYLGATDARALDALVHEFDAEVRVNYETDRTRLHAKAWMFRRASGFDTAYVGSSNLSAAALVEGLEWNVRLSSVGSPTLLDKFRATFETYWESRQFEVYEPERDGERLSRALDVAGGRRERGTVTVTLSGLDVQPKPFQAEMLEQLDAERTLHDRHRNLVVSATGTGKTVVAALDYRRLVREQHGRDLTLLFVAHRVEILRQARRTYQEVLSDHTFGELLSTGETPREWRQVFASVQSLSADRLARFSPGPSRSSSSTSSTTPRQPPTGGSSKESPR